MEGGWQRFCPSRLLACFSILFIVFASITSPAAAEKPGKVFNAKSTELDNGMRVLLVENHRAPVVTHMLWYNVGAADEPPGKSGLAHYLEHLMFKGTKSTKPGEYAETIRALGGNMNAFTGQDYTAYYASIARKHLQKVMRMEADRMQNLAPEGKHITSERKVVLEERAQRTDNDPRRRFREQLADALFVNSSYGTPIIGWRHEIEGLDWDKAKPFYKKWYSPANAILVVSGDVKWDRLKALAREVYGDIPAGQAPERTRAVVPAFSAQSRITMRHKALHQPVFMRNYLVPGYKQDKQDSLALQVLGNIMDGGQSTRLYQRLVNERAIASSVSLYYNSDVLGPAELRISATPAPGVTLTALEKAIEAEIEKLRENAPSEGEVEQAITRLQNEAVYARDSLQGPAMIIGHGLTTGSSLAEIETWPRQIAGVTPKEVRRVADTYLRPDPAGEWRAPVTGLLRPPKETQENEDKKK
jgi:zinc protease